MSDRIPTFADLCSAIAERQLVFAVEDGMYQINALELRRYLNRLRSLPTISTMSPNSLPGSRQRSGSPRISLA